MWFNVYFYCLILFYVIGLGFVLKCIGCMMMIYVVLCLVLFVGLFILLLLFLFDED